MRFRLVTLALFPFIFLFVFDYCYVLIISWEIGNVDRGVKYEAELVRVGVTADGWLA